MITIIGTTHRGQREHNEDCYIADASLGLGMVADGMGGYACGEVASELVKTTIEAAAINNEGLAEAISRAHNTVRDAAKLDTQKKGMGSTAIAVKLQGLDYELAWVGDSRAYLWGGGKVLKQITRDHSYVETLLSTGAISYEESINHPNRNLITQAVGVPAEGSLDIGLIQGRLEGGQQLLLCSDGLVDEVLDHDIARLMDQAGSPEEALNSLVDAAVDAGGHDNITVVIVTVDSQLNNVEAAIEPEIVRSTSITSKVDEAVKPKANSSADIARKNIPIIAEDDTAVESASLRGSIVNFVVLNSPMLIIATSAIVLLVVGLFYFA